LETNNSLKEIFNSLNVVFKKLKVCFETREKEERESTEKKIK